MPAAANALARSRPLPLVPGRSGEHQSRSVGPLPATRTTAGNGPSPPGRVMVPYMVMPSSCQVTSAEFVMPALWQPLWTRPASWPAPRAKRNPPPRMLILGHPDMPRSALWTVADQLADDCRASPASRPLFIRSLRQPLDGQSVVDPSRKEPCLRLVDPHASAAAGSVRSHIIGGILHAFIRRSVG